MAGGGIEEPTTFVLVATAAIRGACSLYFLAVLLVLVVAWGLSLSLSLSLQAHKPALVWVGDEMGCTFGKSHLDSLVPRNHFAI